MASWAACLVSAAGEAGATCMYSLRAGSSWHKGGCLLHRQVGRLFAFQDAARVDAGKAVRFGKVAVAANGSSAQREASRAQRLKSIFNCLSSAMF